MMTGQLFILVIAGFIFSRFIGFSGLANYFSDLITSVQMPPLAVMGIVIIFYIFCGCIMDLLSMLIITLPVVFPLLTGLGFDPFALCVVLVFMGDVAEITPPIGMGCFVIAGVAKVDPMEVFRGITPFFLVLLVSTWIVILFPGVATWLPSLFYK
jgi:TRAP-type C4-dicarboxylate transport system permease large subunit